MNWEEISASIFICHPNYRIPFRSLFDVLLINDGQDLEPCSLKIYWINFTGRKPFGRYSASEYMPGSLRKFEYGTATSPDYEGRGNRANSYMRFLAGELVPAIKLLSQAA